MLPVQCARYPVWCRFFSASASLSRMAKASFSTAPLSHLLPAFRDVPASLQAKKTTAHEGPSLGDMSAATADALSGY
jgi:hypothetical protein